METITIKLTEEESRGFKKYALLNNISLPALFKRTLEEKMETELDMQVIAEYEKMILIKPTRMRKSTKIWTYNCVAQRYLVR